MKPKYLAHRKYKEWRAMLTYGNHIPLEQQGCITFCRSTTRQELKESIRAKINALKEQGRTVKTVKVTHQAIESWIWKSEDFLKVK